MAILGFSRYLIGAVVLRVLVVAASAVVGVPGLVVCAIPANAATATADAHNKAGIFMSFSFMRLPLRAHFRGLACHRGVRRTGKWRVLVPA